jgi:hypothetical protein
LAPNFKEGRLKIVILKNNQPREPIISLENCQQESGITHYPLD